MKVFCVPDVLEKRPVLLGAVHMPPFVHRDLFGKSSLSDIEKYVVSNSLLFQKGGFDGVFIQDQTPGPANYQTVAWTAALARSVRNSVDELDVGIIMDSDDAVATLAAASASGATFVRLKVFVGAMVKANGICQSNGGIAVRARSDLYSSVGLLADVYDRTGSPLGDIPIEVAAKQALTCGADGLIITGKNIEDTISLLERVRKTCSNALLLAGGGVNIHNVSQVLKVADGVIASSSLKSELDTYNWDLEKITEFACEARSGTCNRVNVRK